MPRGEPERQHLVVGASAGGVEALRNLMAELPADFPAAMLVVLHMAPAATSVLPQILNRAGPLPVHAAEDRAAIVGGHVYVAPPNRHLTVEDGQMRVESGPAVNGHRPAVDPLFRSAAEEYGIHAAGVVLSGVLDDGTAGLAAVKAAGGRTLVQDPADALYKGMPTAAIEYVKPDVVADAVGLAAALADFAASPPPTDGERQPRNGDGAEVVEIDRGASDAPQPGEPAGFTCPLCNGSVWEGIENGRVVYRCRIGHEFSSETLAAHQDQEVERALWTALRALEEQAALNRRIADRLSRGGSRTAGRFARRADEIVGHALVLRGVLEEAIAPPDEETAS